MASSCLCQFLLFSTLLLRLLLLLPLCNSLAEAQESNNPGALLALTVTKDTETLQYVTHIHQGRAPMKLVLDLGGQFIWVDSDSVHISSFHPIYCRSLQCSTAMADHNCGGFSSKTTCSPTAKNTVTGRSMKGELIEDAVSMESILGSVSTVTRFLLSSAPRLLLQGLASGSSGMAGLGRTRIGLPSQLVGVFNLRRKFSICLSPPSSSGFIYFGEGSSKFFPSNRVEKSLVYTPLITSSLAPEEYLVGVKSIKINGKRIPLNGSLWSINEEGVGGTKLSTVVPYTAMESSVYEAFTEAFVEEAIRWFNMSRVASVAPFKACFGGGIETAAVPVIDLVLQSELVNWRIYGSNSMVRVSDEVVCLGFLDGGSNQGASMVIGGYQLENNLVEFDLGGSRLGFSSLVAAQTSCSEFNSLHQEFKGSS